MKRCIRHLSYYLSALILIATAIATTPAWSQDSNQTAEPEKEQPKQEEAKKDEAKQDAVKKDEQKEDAKATAGQKPTTLTVKSEPLKIEVSLDGVFEAENTSEMILKPKAWLTFKVLKAVEHGTRVKAGDLLVAMETEKIDRAICDLRAEHKVADLDMKLAEQELAQLEKTTQMDLAAAERTNEYVQDDQDYYLKVDRPMSLKRAEYMLKSSQQQLENQEEELRQLEKMYKADDLTEETEEIVLKRARNAVERARFYFELDKLSYARSLKVSIPRRDVSNKDSAVRASLAYQQSKLALPVALKKQRLALEKLKITRARSEEKLEHLLADRAAMTARAPVAGVVYHGKLSRGKPSSSSSSSSGVRAGSSISAGSVFMTVVKPRPMTIRSSVPEKQLCNVKAGLKGTAVPTGFPELKLATILDRVCPIPTGASNFDARITVALDDKAEAIMPGMTCKVKLVAYENKDAVTVPPKAIETDEADGQKNYVYVVGKKGKHVKRPVKLGKRTATKVEILDGLSAGDKILSEPPKEEK